jgi:hypothetical protein
MTDRELMQQARDALAGYRRELNEHQPCDAERALEERLAQPEPEPVAFIDQFGQLLTPSQHNAWVRWKMKDKLPADDVPKPLYTALKEKNG